MKVRQELVVYTCITGGYDKLYSVSHIASDDINFICFTDKPKLIPDGWETRPLNSPPRLNSGHDTNRYHKLFPHHIFTNYRYSVYIDGNICFNGDYKELGSEFRKSGKALAAFRHPRGRNLEQEVQACFDQCKFDKYDKLRAAEQLDNYRKIGINLSQPITANYFIIRDHQNPLLAETMSLWWSHLFEYSKRDQLSLYYALFVTKLPWAFLDDDLGIDHSQIIRTRHPISWQQKIRTRIRKLINI